jgi:NAD(P)-dependent dehydrogenase (short-subunit alcohol dehydrogenase family)
MALYSLTGCAKSPFDAEPAQVSQLRLRSYEQTGQNPNVVAPGTTDTGMLTRFTNTDQNKASLVSTVPVKRLATPKEIADVIAFVASANASYMTGASIPVHGGMIAD